MKTSAIFAPVLLAPGILAKYSVFINYSPKMVDVGNLDVFAATWQKIYGTSGNTNAIISTDDYKTQIQKCHTGGNANNNAVQVKMEGQWGRNPGLGPNDAREGIVAALWKFLQAQMADNEVALWTDCFYPVPRGPNNPSWYPQTPACTGTKYSWGCVGCQFDSVRCRAGSKGHKVPAQIKITVKNEQGQLMADGLTVNIGAVVDQGNNGCSTLLKTIGGLAAFVPGPGSAFKAGISLACDLGGA
ncbi:Hypothetical protein D9617_2g059070 [Elsinoe fawcettii]|nr:Hypothetical protein D9617_2g059070 [Elsinoe fawcettii]